MRNHVAVISLIACGAWSAPAAAQFELGGGDALDANTGSAYGGRNLPAPVQDFRSRNLLVTRNVGGGRGFRGTVGYTSQFDFRGALGSDDLFRERANSAFSSPRFVAAGRSLERLRFGQYLGEVEYRRAGYGASIRTIGEQRFTPQPMIDDRINLDHFAISSSTSAIYQAKGDGRVVGLLQDGQGQEGRLLLATASSLRGVQVRPAQSSGRPLGLTSYDMARAVEDAEAGRASRQVGEEFDPRFADLQPPSQPLGAEPVSTRIDTELARQQATPVTNRYYLEIMERFKQQYAAARPEQPEVKPPDELPLEEQYEQLRELLAGTRAPTPDDAGDGEDEADDAGSGIGGPRLPMDIAKLAGPLRHGAQVDHLTAEDESRFQELVASGEEKLRDGEYFDAEYRFDRALRFTPGHPLAAAGKGHAQIGAGLYAPAALTLRRLLTQRPEMIDVRYGQELLPSRVRLDAAVDRLRQLMAEQRDLALHAFLLAYIGHQLDKPDLVEQGLETMGKASPDDPLHALLQEVWLP
ncbi:MAG: tetratricopeptide repeat protein [Planctomycetota bacterium]|jgi:hypothetical protein